MLRNAILRFAIGFVGILISTQVLAYDQPALNLGQTSFLDGGPPDGPGFYFQDYLQYYTANRLNDNNGNRLALPKQHFDFTANVFQVIYLSPQSVFDGTHWAVNVMLPWVVHAKMNDGLNNSVLKAQSGIGDFLIGPALQFDPIMGPAGPCFVQRFEVDFIIPTGGYNYTNAVSPSSHFWSVNPYWAFTAWVTPKWSGSMRLNYIWNARNTYPNIAFGPLATSSQAGQAVFANIATEYEVISNFRVGLNGYVLNQFTDTKLNGQSVSGRRERVWAVGPGALYSFSKADGLFFNVYFEQDARNRPQGNSFILRFVHHFA